MKHERYEDWWNATWAQRESLLKATYGETDPPNTVVPFEWENIEVRVSGGCALIFPPTEQTDSQWLTVTHGLTQPQDQNMEVSPDLPSAYGYEFGIISGTRERWVCDALWQVLTYVRQGNAIIKRGHRVPVWFAGKEQFVLGKNSTNDRALGEMRALLFWPHMKYPAGFDCSTGYFSILIGTLITEQEWKLARETSSVHLLLLLFEAGVCQLSDRFRTCLTQQATFRAAFDRISVMREEEVHQELLGLSRGRPVNTPRPT